MAGRSPTEAELARAAPTLPAVLYDGACRFCTAQAERVRRLAGERVRVHPLQDALAELPWIDPEEALRALTLVQRDGRTVDGAQAIVELLRIARPALGALATLYYLPGLRQLADACYRAVAARRYALFGRTPDHEPCADGCDLAWDERTRGRDETGAS